jgi:hypothetical protein
VNLTTPSRYLGTSNLSTPCRRHRLARIGVLGHDALTVEPSPVAVGHREPLGGMLTGFASTLGLGRMRGWWAFSRINAVRFMVEHGYVARGDVAALASEARSASGLEH